MLISVGGGGVIGTASKGMAIIYRIAIHSLYRNGPT